MQMEVLLRVLVGEGELKRIRGEGKKLLIDDRTGVAREIPHRIVPHGLVKRRLSGFCNQFEGTVSEEL